jgi:hypothetical protein
MYIDATDIETYIWLKALPTAKRAWKACMHVCLYIYTDWDIDMIESITDCREGLEGMYACVFICVQMHQNGIPAPRMLKRYVYVCVCLYTYIDACIWRSGRHMTEISTVFNGWFAPVYYWNSVGAIPIDFASCNMYELGFEQKLYLHIYIHAHTHTYTHAYTCAICVVPCARTYIHIYIHTYIYAITGRACAASAYIHTFIHAYIHTRMQTNIHACIHACIHTYIHPCIHVCIHNIHTCMHTCIHTYIHTYMHACIHACMHT